VSGSCQPSLTAWPCQVYNLIGGITARSLSNVTRGPGELRLLVDMTGRIYHFSKWESKQTLPLTRMHGNPASHARCW
jgi:hypothetical protein